MAIVKKYTEQEIRKIIKESFSPKDLNKDWWSDVCATACLSESFIKEFSEKVDWYYICEDQKLSENFIREFKDKVVWGSISYCQVLSEDFIREFQDELDWYHISYMQELSEDFIFEFINKIEWTHIKVNKKIGKKINRFYKNKEQFLIFYNAIKNNQVLEEDVVNNYINMLKENKFLLKKLISKNLLPEMIEQYLLT